MDAKEGKILRLLEGSDKKFIIPVYQRSYDWKLDNCRLLLKDLITMNEEGYKSHFFGSIVYVSNEIGGVNEYIIIDGQQRLTTVSLLLLAIKNYMVDNNLSSEIVSPAKIDEQYIKDKYANDEKKLKLKLVEGDDDAFERIINNIDRLSGNRVTENYEFFYKKLSEMSLNEIEGIYESITKLMVVNISLKPNDGDDDPQLVFESLNSAGLALNEADKIRNYVLMKLDYREQEKFYKIYWKEIERLVGKTNMDDFIKFYLTAKVYDSIRERGLYFSFKNYREKNDLDIEEFLSDIKLYATFYNNILSPVNNEYKEALERIKCLDTNTIVPLLLDLLKSNQLGETTNLEVKEAIIVLENYLVRRTICGLPAASMNKTLAALPKEIRRHMANGVSYIEAYKYSLLNKTQKTRYPSDSEFVDKFTLYELYNAKSSFRKYIFQRLENFNNKEIVNVPELLEENKLTIEHIMPQTMTLEWRKELGANWELIYTKYLHTIGNLTLSAYNSDYSNLSFTKKKELKDKGFNFSKLQLNEFVRNQDKWGEKEIITRANELSAIAKEIWFIPETSYAPQDEVETFTLEDDFDLTSKKIKSFSFLGDTIKTDDITDFYVKMFGILCDFDKTTLIQNANKYFGINQSLYRKAKEVSDGFYIETNLDSNTKIRVVKDAMNLLEIDPSEVLFVLDKSFDIRDDATYSKKKVGDLAYTLFYELLEKNKISDEEIENLMDKGYSRSLFYKLNYPVLSLSRDNYAKGSTKRYYKEPIICNGTKLYITSQWFEEDRDAIIKYYYSQVE